jgi:hypothetical protein
VEENAFSKVFPFLHNLTEHIVPPVNPCPEGLAGCVSEGEVVQVHTSYGTQRTCPVGSRGSAAGLGDSGSSAECAIAHLLGRPAPGRCCCGVLACHVQRPATCCGKSPRGPVRAGSRQPWPLPGQRLAFPAPRSRPDLRVTPAERTVPLPSRRRAAGACRQRPAGPGPHRQRPWTRAAAGPALSSCSRSGRRG